MKKLSLFTMATIIGIAGSTVFSANAADAKSWNVNLQTRNCIVLEGQATKFSELKDKLEEFCDQLDKIDWSNCTVITLPCPNWLEIEKPGETQPGENEPEEEKPEETQPGENEPEEEKPEETQPGENEPEEEKPEGTQPGENEPEEEKPEETQPGENEPEIEKPEETQPGEEKPEETQPGTDIPEIEKPEESRPGTDNNKPGNDDNQTETNPEQLSFAEQVVKLVNEERVKAGLNELTLDKELEAAALVRAKETEISFSHTRPDGRSFITVLKDLGIKFYGAGENIAWGQKSPEEVMRGWMNSEGHRANILNPNFTKIGVGYYQNSYGRNYWTQLFTY